MSRAGLTVGRVSIHAPPGTPSQSRRDWHGRLRRALDSTAIAPPALPPHAVLVVRRLEDPRPGVLLADPPWQAAQQWSQSARRALTAIQHRAARGIEQPPVHVPAVWFADRAEWLACLSWDLLTGRAGACWWWQTWLDGAGLPEGYSVQHDSERIVRLWLEYPCHIPAALCLLVDSHGPAGARWLDQVQPAVRLLLAEATAHAYQLPQGVLLREIPLWRLMPLLPPSLRSSDEGAPAKLAQMLVALGRAPHAAARLLRTYVAEGGDDERRRQQEVNDSPEQVAAGSRFRRSSSPDRQRDALGSDQNRSRQDEQQPGVWGAGAASADGPAAEAAPAAGLQAAGRTGERRPPVQTRASTIPAAVRFTPQAADQPSNAGSERRTLTETVSDPGDGGDLWADTVDQPAGFHVTPDHLSPPAGILDGQAGTVSPTGLASALGGVWYLINLLNRLHLFDTAAEPWPALAELAAALLAEAPPDPLWGVLLKLAEPAERTADPAAGDTWLRGALPAVEHWLTEYLPHQVAPYAFLSTPALLFVTRTHIDVMFSLESIDLDLRRTGLDQDPGWVPALGRIIAFHFGMQP